MAEDRRAIVQAGRARTLRRLQDADAYLGTGLNPNCLQLVARLMDVIAHAELTPALGEFLGDTRADYGGVMGAAADEAERVSKVRPVWAPTEEL